MVGEMYYNLGMKYRFRSVYLSTALLLAFSLASAQNKTVKQVPAKATTSIDGKHLFHEYCAVCHGDDGKGAGPAASALKQSPGDLTQIARKSGGRFPEERFMKIIQGSESVAAHGTQAMPMWGSIFDNMSN